MSDQEQALEELNFAVVRASRATQQLFDKIREARAAGCSFTVLESVTGQSRGTLQNIAAGKSPNIRP